MRSFFAALVLLASVCVPVLLPASAYADTDAEEGELEADPFPARGLVYTGFHYAYAMGGRGDFGSFQYPTLGAAYDHPYLHLSMETPMPYVILDGIVGLIAAAAGEDFTIPLFEALNTERSPGHIRAFDFQGSVRVARWGSQAVELGLRGDMSLLHAYVTDGHVGSSMFNLGPTLGYVVSREDVWLRTFATGGGGFGAETDGNPFVGGVAQGMILVDGAFGLFVRADLIGQSLDLRAPASEASPGIPNDYAEWAAFGSTMFGIGGVLD